MGRGFGNALEGAGVGLSQGFQQGYSMSQRDRELAAQKKAREEDVAFRDKELASREASDQARIALEQYRAENEWILGNAQMDAETKRIKLAEARQSLDETLGKGNLEVARGGLAETKRANVAREGLEEKGLTARAKEGELQRAHEKGLQEDRQKFAENQGAVERAARREDAAAQRIHELKMARQGREHSAAMAAAERLFAGSQAAMEQMTQLEQLYSQAVIDGEVTPEQKQGILADVYRVRAKMQQKLMRELESNPAMAEQTWANFQTRLLDSVRRRMSDQQTEAQALAGALGEEAARLARGGPRLGKGVDPIEQEIQELFPAGAPDDTTSVLPMPPADAKEMLQRAKAAGAKNMGLLSLAAQEGVKTAQDLVYRANEIGRETGNPTRYMVDPVAGSPVEVPSSTEIVGKMNVSQRSGRIPGTAGNRDRSQTVDAVAKVMSGDIYNADVAGLMDGDPKAIAGLVAWRDKNRPRSSGLKTSDIAEYIASLPSMRVHTKYTPPTGSRGSALFGPK